MRWRKRCAYEANLLGLAFLFYSRLPIRGVRYRPEWLVKAFRYIPLVGLSIGGFMALCFWLVVQILPSEVAILAALAGGVWATGGLHEDGFSDCCDAFGGGRSREHCLAIMKDSSVGVYGVIGTIFLLFSKYTILTYVPIRQIPWLLMAMGAFVRFPPILLSYSTPYARKEDEASRSMHLRKPVSLPTLCVALVLAVIPTVVFKFYGLLLLAVPLTVALWWLWRGYSLRKIGGYTGDVLGAVEQTSEVVYLLSYLILYLNPIFI